MTMAYRDLAQMSGYGLGDIDPVTNPREFSLCGG